MVGNLGALQWRTSSYTTEAANCVEVATPPNEVYIRDTKARDTGQLVIPALSWSTFLTSVK